MPRKREPSDCAVDLPMALKVLEDLLAGHLLIYPAELHRRHGGKREAWYKVCAAMRDAEWIAEAATTKDKAYRAGPKCYALASASLDGLMREHDHIVDSVCRVGESLRALDAERRRIARERERRDQLTLSPPHDAPGQMSQRCDKSGTESEHTHRKEAS
jgi:DNA-binding IclR family transcriptional regulator